MPLIRPRKWAASWQNQQNGMCAKQRLRSAWPSAQSDQSLLSAWRKLGFLATHWAHSEDRSHQADAQADLSLYWAHVPFCRFCRALAHLKFIYGKLTGFVRLWMDHQLFHHLQETSTRSHHQDQRKSETVWKTLLHGQFDWALSVSEGRLKFF